MSMYIVVTHAEGSLLFDSVTPAATMSKARQIAVDEFKKKMAGQEGVDLPGAIDAVIALLNGDVAKATINGYTVSIYKEWRRVR